VALLIEMVANGTAHGGELLECFHPPEAKHGPLSSSQRLVRVLSSIVEPAADHLALGVADLFHRRAV